LSYKAVPLGKCIKSCSTLNLELEKSALEMGKDVSHPNIFVLFCDRSLLVVDKPAGMTTLPDGYNKNIPYLKEILEAKYGRLWVVHRLDRGTSGLIIFARTSKSHKNLNAQFEKHLVGKTYHTLVVGEPDWKYKRVDIPLLANGDRRHRTVVDTQRGKTSITIFRSLERFGNYALLEAKPRTGRTHQIRAHLANIGFPIVADELYGGGKSITLKDIWADGKWSVSEDSPIISRPCLHAASLTFTHPILGKKLSFRAQHHKDFDMLLGILRNEI